MPRIWNLYKDNSLVKNTLKSETSETWNLYKDNSLVKNTLKSETSETRL
ncbi:UNVERIFIED_ORG: hypothetical protein QIH99_gp60 [Proteus phage VB_PmiS-Isfahan]|uniref:Uncharacterized protein n=1 Tax=Proteus phage VB_PmiS-Isfahan TaxID=1969841 RepID=A0A1X9Y8C2_9CAUD